jgi:hypothetical protein
MQHCFGRTRDSSERGFNMPVQRRHFSQLLVLILDWLVLIWMLTLLLMLLAVLVLVGPGRCGVRGADDAAGSCTTVLTLPYCTTVLPLPHRTTVLPLLHCKTSVKTLVGAGKLGWSMRHWCCQWWRGLGPDASARATAEGFLWLVGRHGREWVAKRRFSAERAATVRWRLLLLLLLLLLESRGRWSRCVVGWSVVATFERFGVQWVRLVLVLVLVTLLWPISSFGGAWEETCWLKLVRQNRSSGGVTFVTMDLILLSLNLGIFVVPFERIIKFIPSMVSFPSWIVTRQCTPKTWCRQGEAIRITTDKRVVQQSK